MTRNKDTQKDEKQNLKASKTEGDVIQVSNVGSGAAVAAGRGAQASVSKGEPEPGTLALWRHELETKIDALEKLHPDDKDDLKSKVGSIEKEAAKGKDADTDRIKRWLDVIGAMAPEIFEVAVTSLISPAAGVGLVVKKVGEKAQVESKRK